MEYVACTLVVVIVCLLVYIVKKTRDNNAISRATAKTKGTIHKVHRFTDRQDHITTNYWIVRYSVGGLTYWLEQEAYSISEKAMWAHVGEEVAVSYEPENPEKA